MNEFIEKLIGRLEELYNSNDKMKKKAYEKQDWENFELFTHGNEGVKESIEIVNQLAEEYNNDFCEWKKVVIDSTELIREPHRMYLFKESDDKWEYCPYCGKKIKVAPYQPKGENELYRAKSVDGVYQEYNGDWK